MKLIRYHVTDDEWASLEALAARLEIDPHEVARIVLLDQLRRARRDYITADAQVSQARADS